MLILSHTSLFFRKKTTAIKLNEGSSRKIQMHEDEDGRTAAVGRKREPHQKQQSKQATENGSENDDGLQGAGTTTKSFRKLPLRRVLFDDPTDTESDNDDEGGNGGGGRNNGNKESTTPEARKGDPNNML